MSGGGTWRGHRDVLTIVHMGRATAAVSGGLVVLALAVGVSAVELAPGGIDGHPAVAAAHNVAHSRRPDPRAVALRTVERAFRSAPLPPGARAGSKALDKHTGIWTTSSSGDELRRTGWWTAPGTIDTALEFTKHHMPAGMARTDGSGSSVGMRSISFATATTPNAPYGVELDYVFATYHSRIAMRLDAWTVWVPIRPAWSHVPASVTSVDVTVVRKAQDRRLGGAPTVRRTLRDDAARRLATALNAKPSAPDEGIHTCPWSGVDASEVAVFHTPTGALRISHIGGACAFNAQITTAGHSLPAEIHALDFENPLLAALGLPSRYGYRP